MTAEVAENRRRRFWCLHKIVLTTALIFSPRSTATSAVNLSSLPTLFLFFSFLPSVTCCSNLPRFVTPHDRPPHSQRLSRLPPRGDDSARTADRDCAAG